MIRGSESAQPNAATRLVVGMGNPVLGDDAVGWRVVEELQRRLDRAASRGARGRAVQTDCLALGGLRLMERLVGYERVIVVDAIVTGDAPPGTIVWGELPARADDAAPTHTGSAHDTSLELALRLGRALGAPLPSEVLVLAIEAGPCFEFGEELSQPVAAAVPRAVDLLLRELRGGGKASRSGAHTTTGASALERPWDPEQAEANGVGLREPNAARRHRWVSHSSSSSPTDRASSAT